MSNSPCVPRGRSRFDQPYFDSHFLEGHFLIVADFQRQPKQFAEADDHSVGGVDVLQQGAAFSARIDEENDQEGKPIWAGVYSRCARSTRRLTLHCPDDNFMV